MTMTAKSGVPTVRLRSRTGGRGMSRSLHVAVNCSCPRPRGMRDRRAWRSSSVVSSIRVAMVQTWPDGSMTHAVRSPKTDSLPGREPWHQGHRLLHGLVDIVDVHEQHHWRAAVKLRSAVRNGRPFSFDHDHRWANRQQACAIFPSGPGRRTRSSAANVCLMKSISAAGSRQTSRGMTTDAPSGIGLTLVAIVRSRFAPKDRTHEVVSSVPLCNFKRNLARITPSSPPPLAPYDS